MIMFVDDFRIFDLVTFLSGDSVSYVAILQLGFLLEELVLIVWMSRVMHDPGFLRVLVLLIRCQGKLFSMLFHL